LYFAAHAFMYGNSRRLLMQEYVQKLTRTTFPRSALLLSGAELSHPMAPSKSGNRPSSPIPDAIARRAMIMDPIPPPMATGEIRQPRMYQMLAQKTGGSVTSITSAMVEHPIAGVKASVPMITKGGLEAITRSLAMEYAADGIRFNAVAPGIVDTPMHAGDSRDALAGLSPMGRIPSVDDIVDAVIYLTEARHVTGEVLHVDAGAHNGKW
jgi:NAD(P)-dependent dehydrogenase (short-subunit alcohol dehydrogenase family)